MDTRSELPASFSDFLQQMKALAEDGSAARALAERYVAEHIGRFPIIEGSTAHFVALERPGFIVALTGEWSGHDPRDAVMEPIGGGLLHYQHDFEPDARLNYTIWDVPAKHRERLNDWRALRRVASRAQSDPLNDQTGESGLGKRSELAMPQYRRPDAASLNADVPRGSLVERIIASDILQQQRLYTVYLPSGYDPHGAPYPSAYFHDGTDYLTMCEAPAILDNLIAAGAIPPLVAVFVPPQERDLEYNCNEEYTRFCADELAPRVGREYNLADDPRLRAVIGPSMGGIIALFMAWRRPDVFRLVGAQSAVVQGFGRARKFDARKAYSAPPDGFRLHLTIGSYERCFGRDRQGNCRDLLTRLQELRDLLPPRGYNQRYVELHQSHSWGLWRDALPDLLTFLFEGRGTGDEGRG